MAKSDSFNERKSVPPPVGEHDSRVFMVAECGTQVPMNPKWKANAQILFGIEMVSTNHDFGKGFDEPFATWKTFNPIIGLTKEKKPTNYRVFLQQLLNKPLEKGDSFVRSKLVGLPITTIVGKVDDPDDPSKKIIKVTGFSSVSAEEGKEFDKIRNPIVYFEIPEEGEEEEIACKFRAVGEKKVADIHWTECFKQLYPWIQEKIEKSPEFLRACAAYRVKIIRDTDGNVEFVDVKSKAKSAASQDANDTSKYGGNPDEAF